MSKSRSVSYGALVFVRRNAGRRQEERPPEQGVCGVRAPVHLAQEVGAMFLPFGVSRCTIDMFSVCTFSNREREPTAFVSRTKHGCLVLKNELLTHRADDIVRGGR